MRISSTDYLELNIIKENNIASWYLTDIEMKSINSILDLFLS